MGSNLKKKQTTAGVINNYKGYRGPQPKTGPSPSMKKGGNVKTKSKKTK